MAEDLGGWDAAGGRRQAGITVATGLYALEKNVERLAEDHANAQRLVRGLGEIDELSVDPSRTQTNMVFVDIGEADPQALDDSLRQSGVPDSCQQADSPCAAPGCQQERY